MLGSVAEGARGCRAVELGCGTGFLAISVPEFCDYVVATDGEQATVELARENVCRAGRGGRVACRQLRWTAEDAATLERELGPFDFVLSSDLMYYKVDPRAVWAAARALLVRSRTGAGAFLHAHTFRAPRLRSALVAAAAEDGFTTLRVPLSTVVPRAALQDHAHWWNVQCLATLKPELQPGLVSLLGRRARRVAPEDDTDESDESDESDEGEE